MADHKTMRGVRVKDADKGTVEAVFATMNVRDHDGDVILPGAFLDGQKVRISAYNHASWGPGSLPVGKGTIRERDGEAILEGQFFLDTTAGRETFTTVKELDDLGEWSFGFDLLLGSTRQGEHEGEQVRFIGPRPDGTHGIDTHEVSPVLLGAGIGTRTLAVKGLDKLGEDEIARLRKAVEDALASGADPTVLPSGPEGKTLSDRILTVVTDAKAVVDEITRVVDLRASEGKSLGQESKDAAEQLEPVLTKLRDVVTDADEGVDLDADVQLELERARFRL